MKMKKNFRKMVLIDYQKYVKLLNYENSARGDELDNKKLSEREREILHSLENRKLIDYTRSPPPRAEETENTQKKKRRSRKFTKNKSPHLAVGLKKPNKSEKESSSESEKEVADDEISSESSIEIFQTPLKHNKAFATDAGSKQTAPSGAQHFPTVEKKTKKPHRFENLREPFNLRNNSSKHYTYKGKIVDWEYLDN
jgi:hypothetical protein